jgi:DnaJ-class molecular chaperone
MPWEMVMSGRAYVSQHQKCPKCGGNKWGRNSDGTFYCKEKSKCPACGGAGASGKSQERRAAHVLMGIPCGKCKGARNFVRKNKVVFCLHAISGDKIKPFVCWRTRV